MKTLFKLTLVFAALATFALAADKPDFSGSWKMNTGKSMWGPIPPPTSFDRKVTHAEPSLTIEDTQTGGIAGDQHDSRKYTTDGTEITYQAQGADVKSSATWDNDAIQINSKATAGGMDIDIKEKMTLSSDGKTMTSAIHIGTAQGDLDVSVVFDKQ
jgi:hypothetical protein